MSIDSIGTCDQKEVSFYDPNETTTKQEKKECAASEITAIFIDPKQHAHQTENLRDFLSHSWLSMAGRDERLKAIDPLDVEVAHLLMWILGYANGDASHIVVYPKNGLIYKKPIYGLNLTNLPLTFPIKIGQSVNTLSELIPHVTTLSPPTIKKIMDFPLDRVISILRSHHLEAFIDAFSERISLLQSFMLSHLSIQEINQKLNHIKQSAPSSWLKA